MGGVGEVLLSPGGRQEIEGGKGWESDEIRTAMERMYVGEVWMDQGGAEEAEEDNTEAEGGVRVGSIDIGTHKAPNSGYGVRRHNTP